MGRDRNRQWSLEEKPSTALGMVRRTVWEGRLGAEVGLEPEAASLLGTSEPAGTSELAGAVETSSSMKYSSQDSVSMRCISL